MIAEATLALEYGASAEDVARVCHPHPVSIYFIFTCVSVFRHCQKHYAKPIWLLIVERPSTASKSPISFIVCNISAQVCNPRVSFIVAWLVRYHFLPTQLIFSYKIIKNKYFD